MTVYERNQGGYTKTVEQQSDGTFSAILSSIHGTSYSEGWRFRDIAISAVNRMYREATK